jgi:branched-chain amino acid transport system permease protein
MENYLLAMGVYAGLYALMALGLNVIWGLAGMANLGLVGFFAIGAYVSALLSVRLHWPMGAAWAAAATCAAVSGTIVALITARLRGDYLAIVTLGFAEVIRLVASNEVALTNGTDGISGIPAPFRAALAPAQFNLLCLAVVWVVVAITAALLGRLSLSPFGRVLRAIREDEMVAAVAGKPVLRFKLQAFTVGAAILGLAGALYAHYNSYVAPEAFQPLVTIYIVLALTVGGTGSMRGAIIGAILVVALTEGTRFAGGALPVLRPVQVAALREGMIGMMLIAVLMMRPEGLLPERLRRYEREIP